MSFIAGDMLISAGIGAGTGIYGANVSAGTQRDLYNKNEELWGGQLYKQLPEFPESDAARGEWWNRLQQWGQDPNYGAITPAWDEIWKLAEGKVNDYYSGTATTPGLNAKIKASAARRGVSGSPALEEVLTRSGIDQGQQIKDLASQQAISKAEFGENARGNWLKSLMQLTAQKPQYMTRTGVTGAPDSSGMWNTISSMGFGLSSQFAKQKEEQETMDFLQNYLSGMEGNQAIPGATQAGYGSLGDFRLGNANYSSTPAWAEGLSFN